MSQLISNATKYDLSLGFSWHAAISLRATSQPRRKVIFELADQASDDTIFAIELDKKDRLSLIVSDRRGRSFETPRVTKSRYEGKFIWLAANIIPRAGSIGLSLDINGNGVTAEGKSADFSGEILGVTSMGSASDGSYPASFQLAELVFINRVLNAQEVQNLSNYFTSKHQLELG